jgi:ATP-dependent DNA helicase RecG
LQELKGAALDRFILRKQGKTWDGVPVPYVGLADLSSAAIATFRKLAGSSGRLERKLLDEPDPILIEKLKLTEGDYLKRAAVLLFHEDPERFVTGAFVKIGFFRSESDLVYHDEVHGDLFTQTAQTVDLIRTKYLKAAIHYEGLQRIETFPIPYEALRESVLNALIHRDYSTTAPIQIKVFADRLKIWNPAVLPDGWDLAKLLGDHASHPFNPDIANAFFRAGEIESWGRGIQRIFEACQQGGAPDPVLRLSGNDLWTEFPYSPEYLKAIGEGAQKKVGETSARGSVKSSVKSSVKTPDRILALLETNPEWSLADVAEALEMTVRGIEKATAKLVEKNKLKYIGPQKGGHWEVLK